MAGVCLVGSGCTLDASGLGDRTTQRPDGGMDAAMVGRDAGGLDAGGDGVDAGVTDAGFDAGVDAGFDAGVDAGPPRSPCGVTFAGISGYRECEQTSTECRFFRRGDWRTCDEVCGSRGRSCVRADQEGFDSCDAVFEYPCDWDGRSQICTCAR